ncbi:MAG TPA: ABC transporter permease [Trebonia sp.]|jgi:ABC-type transport system involved in multi-copper enzyme maturation permease subunit|nr:ABC transporter permease [Trebonia sp.]
MATMTTPAGPDLGRAALPPATSGRAGLAGSMRAEWTKLRSLRSTYWTLLALVLTSVGLGTAISAASAAHLSSHPADKLNYDPTFTSLFAFVELGSLILAVLGALVITSEYSTGMIRTSLTVQPRRGVLLAAKGLVFAGVALVVALVISLAAFFLGQWMFGSVGVAATLSQPHVLQAVVGTALYVALVALFAFGLGAMFRNTAATITTAIAVLFVLPVIVDLLPQNWSQDIVRWLPNSAGEALASTVGPGQTDMFSSWGQFAVTAAYAAAALVAGTILVRRRDA